MVRRRLGLALLFLLATSTGAGCVMDAFQNKVIEGSFTSSREKFGEWDIAPVSCVDGKERGFEGIAFGFGPGPIHEIRRDSAQEGNNTIELHMADTDATVYRVFEPQCTTLTGDIHRSNVTINNRHMFRLVGAVEFDCPEAGIRGRATFDGCLPQTL